MNRQLLPLLAGVLIVAPVATAQKWEVGGGAGGGFYTSRDVAGSATTGSVTIKGGLAASGWLANNTNKHWGGEIRYDFQMGNLQVSSGSTTASFSSVSHAFHYDLVYHTAPPKSKTRPFVAFGGGVKDYRGTGTEVAAQPLNGLALLTKTSDLKGLISVGGGVKFNAGRFGFRLEVHDYLTPFPTKVIAPAQGAKIGGWIQDLVVGFGVSMLN